MSNKWQLYSTVPGWRKASGILSRALEAALKGKPRTIEGASAAYMEWRKVAATVADFGALDSEPCWVASDTITKRLGVRG